MRGLTAWFQQPGPQQSSLVITQTTFACAEREITLLQSSGVLSPNSSQNMNTGYSHRWLFVGSGGKGGTLEQYFLNEAGPSTACRFTALVLEWFSMSLCSVVNACLFYFWPEESEDRPFLTLSGFSLSTSMFTEWLSPKKAKWMSSTANKNIPACCYIGAFGADGSLGTPSSVTGFSDVQSVMKPGKKNVEINIEFTINLYSLVSFHFSMCYFK